MPDTTTECETKPLQQRIALAQITMVARRLHEDSEGLLALGKSLRQGQLQAIGVMEVVDQPGHYHLIWGERRMRAAQRVGLTTLEAVVLPPMDAAAALLIAWRENERADLTDVERLGMIEQAWIVLGAKQWRTVEAALRISEPDRKRLVALKRLDPEALAEAGRRGVRAYALTPLLQLIRQRRNTGQRSIPETMQVRIIRELSYQPTLDYCQHLVKTYFPAPATVQRPEEERLVEAFTGRLSSLTDAIHAIRRASQASNVVERESLRGSIGRVMTQLETLQRELGAGSAAQAA